MRGFGKGSGALGVDPLDTCDRARGAVVFVLFDRGAVNPCRHTPVLGVDFEQESGVGLIVVVTL